MLFPFSILSVIQIVKPLNRMKRILFILGIAIICFASCSKLENLEKNIVENPKFIAYVDNEIGSDENTKTYLDKNMKILWHAQDELSIFSSTLNEKFQFDGQTGDNSGTFTKIGTGDFGSGNQINRNYAIYPFNKSCRIENDESFLTLVIPSTQYYAEGSIGKGANIAVAVTNDLNDRLLTFKNVCGFYRLLMCGVSEDYIKSIEIVGRNGEKLTGEAKVIISEDKLPVTTILDNENASESIILDCGEKGAKIGTSTSDADMTEFWIAISPRTFTSGLNILITNANGDRQIIERKTSQNFERNKYNTLRIRFDQSKTVNINKEKERNALIAIYNALGGENWTNNTNWCSEQPVGEWYGVDTDADGYVTNLDLSSNNLQGEIPAEIGDFSRLNRLNLAKAEEDEALPNNITGTIPEEICKLTSLEWLYLSNNQLEGQIPENIGNLVNMRHMHLWDNKLTGSIPESIWTGMSKLEHLLLQHNELTGGPSSNIGKAVNLTELWLDNNNFKTRLPAEICNLVNLRIFYAHCAGFSGEIPENIGNMQSLEMLELGGNNLSGTIPESLGNLANLKYVSFGTNGLRGAIPNSIGNLKNVEHLIFDNNMIEGNIPESIGGCTELVELNIHSNRISGAIPASIGNCTKLQRILAWSNNIDGILPAELGNCGQLVWIDLAYNKIGGILPAELGNLTNLEYIKLEDNRIYGSIPSTFGNLKKLHTIFMSSNKLSGSLPDEICQMSNLECLHLNSNALEGEIPANIGNLTKMKDLSMGWNKFTGKIPASMQTMTQLEFLELSGNQLSGNVIDFAPMTNLKYLYLAWNAELCGIIPAEVFEKLAGYTIDGTKINVEEESTLQDPEVGQEEIPWE